MVIKFLKKIKKVFRFLLSQHDYMQDIFHVFYMKKELYRIKTD